MAYNDKKILQVLLGELEEVPERCEGYRKEMKHLLGDVLIHEREHANLKNERRAKNCRPGEYSRYVSP